MKHLKKYESHINSLKRIKPKTDLPEYSDPFEGFSGKVYFIAPEGTREDKPWTRVSIVENFKEAYDRWEDIQKKHNYNYGIYEANIKPLSKQDIKFRKDTNKYNL